jgi:hypothetical protein
MTHLSLHAYQQSRVLEMEDFPFSTLIATAYRKADGENKKLLESVFPDICKELHYRYWSGGGLLPGEPGYDPDYDDNLPLKEGS